MSSSLGRRSQGARRLLRLCLLALAAALTFAPAGAQANATVPGTNGKIAFASNRDFTASSAPCPSSADSKPDCAFEIYTMNPDGSGVTRLTNNLSKDDKPSWSPDGKQIAFESRRDCATTSVPAGNGCKSNIYVMNEDGSNVRQLTSFPDSATHPTWSPDGTQIAFERGDFFDLGIPDRIWVVPAAGGPAKMVDTLGDPNASPDSDILPAWSPLGNEIAYTRVHGFNLLRFSGPNLGPQLARFFLGEGSLKAVDDDLKALNGRQPIDVTTTFWFHTFVENADGSGVANPIGDVNGCDIGKLFATDCVLDTNPAWAPDGARLAIQRRRFGCELDFFIPFDVCFNQSGHATNDVDVVTQPRDGSSTAILQADEPADCGPQSFSDPNRLQCFSDHKPAYSPQNDRIAFHSDREAVANTFGVPFGGEDCVRLGPITDACPFTIHTMPLLGNNVSGALGLAPNASDRNPDWQPVFLAPTSFAFVSGCSTDGVVPVGTIANSPGKGAVDSVHFRIDGGAEQSAPVSNGFATIHVPNGQHTLSYWGVNQAGVAEAPHTASVLVDTVNHCGSAIGVGGVRTVASCASRNFVARFAVSSAVGVRQVQVFLDGRRIKSTASSSFGVTINVKKLRRGRHVLRTVVTDVNGQTLSGTRTFRACASQQVKPRRRSAPRFTG